MSEARIGIYLRLRPPRRTAGRVVADTEGNLVEFNVPKDAAQGLINNSKESYKFQFDGIFAPEAQQDAVFEMVARPAVLAALDGINGTVFAYGQTGSGKTFTVTGGTERYADRGLIPRALAALFAEAQRRPTHSYSIAVSYLELYNEEGFDLLDPTREVKRMEDLPKVFVMEDDDSRMHIRNLSAHRTTNEEEALNLLFLGDTNRMVAETPLNQASSRSHAIFTIQIEARKAGEDKVRRSKLNFVDLAGSERVTKTGIEGHTLKEAKYINLSLHYLEQVIIALQEGRPHIPYRNSLLTQMLRDSLGGNCRTSMIATVAPETQHVEESISTCRFAQRVAMISNQVMVNEEVDPSLVIKRLKEENQLLRQELQLLKGGGAEGGGGPSEGDEPRGGGEGDSGQLAAVLGEPLGEEQRARLARQVRAYVEDASPDASLDVEASMPAIRAVFSIFKSLLRDGRNRGRALLEGPVVGAAGDANGGMAAPDGEQVDLAEEVVSLRSALKQREREVAVLTGMLRKQGADPQAAVAAAAPAGSSPAPLGEPGAVSGGVACPGSAAGVGPLVQPLAAAGGARVDEGLLADKNRAFEYFCSSSPTHDAVLESKALLRGKYEEAKGLGAQVNASKQRLGELKGLLEQRRVQRSLVALMQGQQAPEGEEDPEEERAKGLIDKEKALYREALAQLRELKSEIDRLQALLEHSRARLQREFQTWHSLMLGQLAPEQRQRVEQLEKQLEKQQQGVQQQQQQQQYAWSIAAVQPGAAAAPRQAPQVPSALPSLPAAPALRPPSRQVSAQASAASLVQPPSSAWAAAEPMPPGGDAPQQQAPRSARAGSRPATPRQAQQQQQQSGGADYAGVDPDVLAAARPLLTGNPAADADIIKFYQARAALLRSYRL